MRSEEGAEGKTGGDLRQNWGDNAHGGPVGGGDPGGDESPEGVEVFEKLAAGLEALAAKPSNRRAAIREFCGCVKVWRWISQGERGFVCVFGLVLAFPYLRRFLPGLNNRGTGGGEKPSASGDGPAPSSETEFFD